jgi:arsenate reductase
MAEGFLRFLGGKDFEVSSAGTHPTHLNPLAIEVMAENQIDITHQTSKSVATLVEKTFDFVITLCDSARESCPVFFNPNGEKIQARHWGYPDPAAVIGNKEVQLQAFRQVAMELKERIRQFVAVERKQ